MVAERSTGLVSIACIYTLLVPARDTCIHKYFASYTDFGVVGDNTMRTANPYLYFDGDTEAAFEHYRSVFDVEFLDVVRYGDLPGNPMGVPDEDLDKIAHITLPLGDSVLMGTDAIEGANDIPSFGDSFQIRVEPESAEEAEQLFAALSDGGEVVTELQREGWSEKHGSCVDKFGIQWMIDYEGDVKQAG